jgi:hypothetical protein
MAGEHGADATVGGMDNDSMAAPDAEASDHAMAGEDGADATVGGMDNDSTAAPDADELPTEVGPLSSDAYGADEASV